MVRIAFSAYACVQRQRGLFVLMICAYLPSLLSSQRSVCSCVLFPSFLPPSLLSFTFPSLPSLSQWMVLSTVLRVTCYSRSVEPCTAVPRAKPRSRADTTCQVQSACNIVLSFCDMLVSLSFPILLSSFFLRSHWLLTCFSSLYSLLLSLSLQPSTFFTRWVPLMKSLSCLRAATSLACSWSASTR